MYDFEKEISSADLNEYLDFLQEKTGFNRPMSPDWIADQKKILSKLVDAYGPKSLKQHLSRWAADNSNNDVDYSNFMMFSKKHVRMTPTPMKIYQSNNSNVGSKKNIRKNYEGFVNLWDSIYKPIESIPVDGVMKLSETFEERLEDQFFDATPAEKKILKYVNSTMRYPLVISSKYPYKTLTNLLRLRNRLLQLDEHCIVSPCQLVQELHPNGVWQDFPSDMAYKDLRETFLLEMQKTGNRLGFVSLQMTDDPKRFHPEFKRFLLFYAYNHRLIISVEDEFYVPDKHWLLWLLKYAVTLDIDD